MAPLLLAILGVTHLIGSAGVLEQRRFYSIADNGLITTMTRHDITGWAVAHLVIGVLLLAVAAWAVFGTGGWSWIRWIGITLALLSVLANAVFLAYHPFWTLLALALGVAVTVVLMRRRAPRSRRLRPVDAHR